MNLNKLALAGLLITLALINTSYACDSTVSDYDLKVDTRVFTGVAHSVFRSSCSKESQGTIIGIHGTPGSASAWNKIMESKSFAGFDFLAIDRLGWGGSQTKEESIYPFLSDQADLVDQVLKKGSFSAPIIIMAHSWGGPVALELASRASNRIDAVVLIASPANPQLAKPRWYHKLADQNWFNWAIGSTMRRSNIEMMSLESELTKLSSKLDQIRVPVAIIQGKKDRLVPYENAFYIQKKLVNSPHMLLYQVDENHFIPFSNTALVAEGLNWVVKTHFKGNDL
jgi:pimeloyl-ACP methyl ester carboxylesterase